MTLQSFFMLLGICLGLSTGIAVAAPANDSFASAQVLIGNSGSVAGGNVGATGEAGEPIHFPGSETGGTGSSVWFSWTPVITGPAVITTSGSSFDTVLALYTGSSLQGLTKLVADDDSGGWPASRVTLLVTTGTTYRIAVGSYYLSQRGNIVLNYTVPPPAAAPVLTGSTNLPGRVGVGFASYKWAAVNYPTAYQATGLPPGVVIHPSTGVLSGVPTQAGSFNATVSATNSTGTGSIGCAFHIQKGWAPLIFSNLNRSYDGSPKPVTVTTQPAGLAVSLMYGDSSTAPTSAGTYAIIGAIQDFNYEGSASTYMTIAKAPATVALGDLAAVYDGTPKPASATTSPAGLVVSLTYNGSPTPPTAVGSYTVVATVNDPNLAGSTTGQLVISKIAAGISLANSTVTYDGTPKTVVATTVPAGLNLTYTYNGSQTPPVSAGSYAVIATVSEANYSGSSPIRTLVISKAPAGIVLGSLSQGYNGSPRPVTATTTPAGLGVSFTYDGSPTAPVNAASYTVVGTINSPNHTGSVTGTLVVTKPLVAITFGNLQQAYNGTPRSVTATTNPAGLATSVTYNGSATPPTAPGSYPVTCTVSDANHTGSSTATLVISKGVATITFGGLSQVHDGNPKIPVVLTNPPGLNLTLSYNNGLTPPVSAGSYSVLAVVDDVNYAASSTATLVITKAAATVSLSDLAAVYDGFGKSVSTTTNPPGLNVISTYNGSSVPPANAGTYSVASVISSPNHAGSTTGTLTIAKAAATVTLYNLTATYNGSPRSATAVTTPAGLPVVFTYDGSSSAPSALGTYNVVGTINAPNHTGSASGVLTIKKPSASILLGNLVQIYNGSPRAATATTNPAGLAVTLTYNGSATAPSAEGNYAVVATLADSNYEPASVTGTLMITLYPDPYVFTTLTGSGNPGSADGTSNWAQFNSRLGVAVDGNGVVYVAAGNNYFIRKVTPDGTTSILAGSSTATGSADGTGTDARFSSVGGITLDNAGNLIVTDNRMIRKVTPTGEVITLAGLAGTSGSADGTGAAARFSSLQGVAVDGDGNMFVADVGARTIRKITPAGVVTTLAGLYNSSGSVDGTGNAARFATPYGIAVNKQTGMIYVTDYSNFKIRAITQAGVVTTFAGAAGTTANVDGDATTARFRFPLGITVDAAGNLYVSDNGAIRKISPDVTVTTLGGAGGTTGYVNGTGGIARFNNAYGLSMDGSGYLYIADWQNHVIRKGTSALQAGPPVIFNPPVVTSYVGAVAPAYAIAARGAPSFYSATGLPQGLTVNTSTGAISGTPAVAGSYPVTLGATNSQGSTTSALTWVVSKYQRAVTLTNLTATYDGTSKSVIATASSVPAGNFVITYNGSTTPPSALGTYTVVATINDPTYLGSATGTFNIVKPIATIVLGNLVQLFDGTARVASVTTTPPGLSVSLSYAGNPTAPVAAGAYPLVATLNDDTYQPLVVNATLEISTYPTPYTFTTLAGRTGGVGSEDGPKGLSRFNFPAGVAVDGTGNVYIADTTNHTIRKINAAGTASTFAGVAGTSGTSDGTGAAARFNSPGGVVVDPSGNVYVADAGNHTIRRITPAGVVTTLAGLAGTSGTANGTGSVARFKNPAGLAFFASTLYVADTMNHAIRKVTSSGVVTTLAGTVGTAGTFQTPYGLTVDLSGNVFVADTNANRILKVTPAGAVSILAGKPSYAGYTDETGQLALFYKPRGITCDSLGNLYVAESDSHVVRKVTQAGVVTTLVGAGSGIIASGCVDGTSPTARFFNPCGITIDSSGNFYVADTGNHAIRKITAGAVSLFAGGPFSGSVDGTGQAARFYDPKGVAVDQAGNLYIADTTNFVVRKVTPAGVVTTLAGLARTSGYVNATGSAARFSGMRGGVAVDSAGNVYVSESARIRKITPGGEVTNYAGLGGLGASNGAAQNALFNYPSGLAFDSADNLYVADSENHLIRKITPTGIVSTVAGTAGIQGSADGQGTAATFRYPKGMAVDAAGNLYVSDSMNYLIRKINAGGLVSTLAGTAGVPGSADGPVLGSRFYNNGEDHAGIAVDADGNVFVADIYNNTIRLISANGEVSTLAGRIRVTGISDGTGTEVGFNRPCGLALDPAGNLYVVGNNAVRKGSIIPATPVITSPLAATARVDTYFNNYRLTASGAATTYGATGLPPGLTMQTTTGIITGTPEQDGVFPVTISAGNTTGTATATLAFTVEKRLAAISLDDLAQTFNGAPRPVTVTTIPSGLSNSVTYNGSSAIPTLPGSYAVVATVEDSAYHPTTVSGMLVISTTLNAYTFSTFAGTAGQSGSADGTGAAARFAYPHGIASDAGGNLYVADSGTHVIRKITPSGVVSTYAGSPGLYGSANGTTSAARFAGPCGVALDLAGNVYVADTGNATVRKITPAGQVTTLAGSAGSGGSNDGTGSAARFGEIYGIAVDSAGIIYVADHDNATIRKITPAGVVTTLAGQAGLVGHIDGTGSAARFGGVASLAVDRDGVIYAADYSHHTIRKITPAGVVTTLAGSPGFDGSTDGVGSAARFHAPLGIAVDGAYNVYVADCNNQKIRKITAAGKVTTIAGSSFVYESRDGTGYAAYFLEPIGIATDGNGNIYVVDRAAKTIRKGLLEIGPGAPVISSASTATATYGSAFSGYSILASASPTSYSATGLPPGLVINTTTGAITGTPLQAGIFQVLLRAFNSSGHGSGDLVIHVAKASASFVINSLSAAYNGTPRSASATTVPAGLTVNLTYDGSTGAPTALGSYDLVATISNPDYAGSFSGIFTITPGTAVISLGGLQKTYDGLVKFPAVAISPAGLNVTVTYDGGNIPPVEPGSYEIAATVSDPRYTGATSGTMTIAKAGATVSLGSLAVSYDGSVKPVAFTTNPPGLTVNVTYGGSPLAPSQAGTYPVSAVISDPYFSGGALGTLVISKVPAMVSLSNLAATYDGNTKPADATTIPAGLGVTLTYNGNTSAPRDAGTYAVVASLTDPNYTGGTSGTLTISPTAATISLSDLDSDYDGMAKAVTATTAPGNLAVSITYGGSTTAPVEVGSYPVVATVTDPNYTGATSGTKVITAANATVTLGNLDFTYDGTSKQAAATTLPAGLAVTLAYNGSTTPPVDAGSYAVSATVASPGHSGSAVETLVIARATAVLALEYASTPFDGTAKTLTATTAPAGLAVSLTYNGSLAAPTAAGTYQVEGVITDPNHSGDGTGTLEITRADASVTLADLIQDYDGTPRPATAATNPPGLPVAFTYGGSPTPPTAAGSYPVVGTITGGNYQGSASAILVVSPNLASFQAQLFTTAELAQPEISGPMADPDGDGINNMLEYAFVLDPKSPDSSGLPAMSNLGDHLILTFIRRKDASDLEYEMETTDDLSTWASGKNQTEVVSVTTLDATREQVVVRDLESRTSNPLRYVRVKVSNQ